MERKVNFMIRLAAIFLLTLFSLGCQPQSEQTGQVESSSVEPVQAESSGMVVTANPHATNAGIKVLEAGGSALDAAIAIEAVLSLVEPQSSGLGGGGFMLHYDASTGDIEVYMGRETAPAGATAEMFLGEDGNAMGFFDAKNSGLSIGVPGIVSMFALAHEDHGNLPWSSLFDSAIELAEQGFEVSPRLSDFLSRFQQFIPSTPEQGPTKAYEYFYEPDGSPKAFLVNPEYANTLQLIKEDAQAFYTGEIAEAIVEAASAQPRAGSLALSDFSSYQATKVKPLCVDYKGMEVCGPPPPSSWVAVGMTMSMLETAPRFLVQENRLSDWNIWAEALRLAYADRDQYVADSDFIDVPLEGLLNPDYMASRADLIDPEQAIAEIFHGDPWAYQLSEEVAYGLDQTEDYAGTTHFSVVDAEGNVVSLTASVESIFGSTRMAGGMFLNNQLTDFSRTPTDETGELVANAVAPFKRPRSSMSPTIVLDSNDEFLMSSGSPGGNSIISYTLKTLVGVLDWGLTPQEAVDLPNLVARGDTVRIESERASAELIQSLKDYGFNVQESEGENSGLSLILRNPDGSYSGGVDPRREGTIGLPAVSN